MSNDCNCAAIRSAMGGSDPEDLIDGHEGDCVATNAILAKRAVADRWNDHLSISLFFAFVAHDAFSAAYKMGIDNGLATFDVHVAAMVIAQQHVNDLITRMTAS